MGKTIRHVERHYPNLRDRLLTALETVHKKNPALENPVSRALAVSLQEEMKDFMDHVGFHRAASLKKILPPLLLIISLAAVGSVHAMVQPEFWGIAYFRLTKPLNPEDFLKSGMNQLLPKMEIRVSPGNCEIPKGSSLQIDALVKGYSPVEVQLYVKEENAGGWQVFPMKSIEKGHYQTTMTHVLEPAEYYVKADHGQSRNFRITLFETIKIARALWRLEFPKYMRLPEQRKEGWRDKMTVPQGTKLHLELSLNRPVEGGSILSGDRKIALESAGPSELRASFEAREDQVLRLEVKGKKGELLLGVPSLWIQTIPDLSPFLEVLEPQIQNYVFPTEEIPFVVSVNDDYGIRRVTLVIRHQAKEERVELLAEGETPDSVTLKTLIPLEKYKLRSRGLVFAYIEVEDIYPGEDKHLVHSPLFTFLIRDYVEQFKMDQPEAKDPSMRMLFEGVLIKQEEIMQETWDYISRLPVENPVGWETPSEEGFLTNGKISKRAGTP